MFNGTVLAWREATLQLNKAGKHFTVSLKQMFDTLTPSAVFPPESQGCAAGLQGGRKHGAEDIIYDLYVQRD